MGSAVGLREDFSALDLRGLARRSGDTAQAFGFGGDLGGRRGVADGARLGVAVQRAGPGGAARLI